ncbi:Ger(x)C family spore germination protein [Pseudogracilibacillus sp. ICA-222130]|uniref:Ger(x)C family spore germination protein n=1 Tax=Pseudogracilibacillus sp. ICA-222130 TaxID=3134655 RepID=UPI0030C25239
MRSVVVPIILLLLLTGCWDQRLLKEHSLILAIGYDLTEDGKIEKTITFPAKSGGGGQVSISTKTETISVIANTVKGAEIKTDEYSPEKFDRSKAKVIIIGKDLAEKGIFPALDSVYRDLRAPLYASVAIVEGTAKDALEVEDTYSLLTSDFYSQLLTTATEAGIIKDDNIQEICPIILSDGKDIIIPRITLLEDGKRAKISGSILLNGDKWNGKLNLDENVMLLTLMGEANKNRKMNLLVDPNEERQEKRYVNFSLRNEHRQLTWEHTGDNDITVTVKVSLQIEIDEYASDHLYDEKKAKQLVDSITKQTEKRAKKTIEKIQEANNDALGVGEKIKAYDPQLWQEINWKETYPEIEIVPEFDIEIIRHGILN